MPSFLRPYASLISCGGEAVVEPHLALVAVLAHLDADMTEAVELRAGLADLGGEKLVMIHKLVVAERAAGRTTGNAQREHTRAEQRHALLVDAADLVDLAVLDPFRRIEDLRRRDVVGCAGLVVLAPFRGPPWLVDSLGHRGGRLRLRCGDRRERELAMHRARERRPRSTGQAGGAEQGPAIGFCHPAFLLLFRSCP